MNINRIEALKQERGRLDRELNDCDAAVRNLTRIRSAAKAEITKLQSRPLENPIENRERLACAKINLEAAKQKYSEASSRYYRIIEQIRKTI